MRPTVKILIFAAAAALISFMGSVVWKNTTKERFLAEFENVSLAHRRVIFQEFSSQLDTNDFFDALEKKFPICHAQAHDLGKVIYAKQRDVAESIMECGKRCTDGCFHGVLMEAFKDIIPEDAAGHIEFSLLRDRIREICNDPIAAELQRIGNCAHGVGHALAYLSAYDIEKGLAACNLFNDIRLTYYCAGGVFMEYDLIYGSEEMFSKPLHFPCDTYTAFPAACYRYKAKRLLKSLNTLPALAKECMSLEGYARLGCFHGLGFSQLDAIAKNPAHLKNICGYGTPDDRTICIEGAIEKLADVNTMRAHEACALLPSELLVVCENAANQRLYTLEKFFDLYFFSGNGNLLQNPVE